MASHQEVYLKVLVSKLYYYSYTTRENAFYWNIVSLFRQILGQISIKF